MFSWTSSPRLVNRPLTDLTDKIVRDSPYPITGGYASDIHKCMCDDKPRSPSLVAIKAFRYFASQHPKEVERRVKDLRRKLGTWRRLEHPNIVPLLGVADGFGPIQAAVLPWMPNGSLHSFMQGKGQTLTVGKRLYMLFGIVSGLEYLHLNCVFHGDLHTGNVLIDGKENPRISDFGLSSAISKLQPGLSYLERLSKTAGAVRWAAPERLSGSDPHSSGDMYSFGCIMFEVLSGDIPWKEKNDYEVAALKLREHDPPSHPAVVENEHWALMVRCWAPPQQRPTAKDVGTEVREFKVTDDTHRCKFCRLLGTTCDTTVILPHSQFVESGDPIPSDATVSGGISLGEIIKHLEGLDPAKAERSGALHAANSTHQSERVLRPKCPEIACQWLDNDEDAPGLCGNLISCKNAPRHFTSIHGIKGMHGFEHVFCRWEGCFLHVFRKNFVRHVRECHLSHIRGKGHI